ncbi:hypothetical protein HOT81_gp015 [Gordonia phage Fryberger]|uniref:Uncharacterized protein n=1 Tax=Gordonia phage Fryberger TaxID=2250392 RepID=A0A346FCU6_9CAUD|nr:hypothetical protein HOT81_gp015 [Gordonia phage Fryberger]AXN53560.1 hypothetical protein SEA_FRYBERGER_15 [Gordonia phage Fryberger]
MIYPPFVRRLSPKTQCRLGIHEWGDWWPRDRWEYINEITRDGYRSCKHCSKVRKFRTRGYQKEWLKKHPGWSDAGF